MLSSLKELYVESLQKWKEIQKMYRVFDFDKASISDSIYFRHNVIRNKIYSLCSFCRDSNDNAHDCRINPKICDNCSERKSLFNQIYIQKDLESPINSMVTALTKELEGCGE